MSRQPRLFEPEVPIPEELRPAVEAWLAYKAKRKESYKCVESVADLVERMAEMGAVRAMAAVKWSRSQNWSGLYEQKQDRRPMPEVPGGLPEDWTYLTRDEQRMALESARNSPEARRRRGEEWWAALSEEERSEIERLREEYQ